MNGISLKSNMGMRTGLQLKLSSSPQFSPSASSSQLTYCNIHFHPFVLRCNLNSKSTSHTNSHSLTVNKPKRDSSVNIPSGFIHTNSTVVTNSARGNDSITNLHEPDDKHLKQAGSDGQGKEQDMKVSESFNNRRRINGNSGHISSSNSKGEREDEMSLGNDELQESAAYESFLAGETDFLDLAKQSEIVGEKSAQQELKSDYGELIGGKSRKHGGNQRSLKLNKNANSDKEVESESKSKNSRQAVKRSNVIAKQVISKTSALSMGFVSQLWVDTTSWTVEVVEIRPSLLSGEMERIFLEELCQVGDVILVEDENMLDNEPTMLGLDSLVGYDIVTEDRYYLGKVRDYNFNINLGSVSYLVFDSFGISFIPASVVSTYSLSIEDVVEVSSDTIVVCCGANFRVQRLTKGLWEAPNMHANAWNDAMVRKSNFRSKDYVRHNRMGDELEKELKLLSRKHKSNKGLGKRSTIKESKVKDEWEPPLDY